MEITHEESNFSTSTANEFVVLIPGGGGSAKTGVKNMVQVAKPTRSGVFGFMLYILSLVFYSVYICNDLFGVKCGL